MADTTPNVRDPGPPLGSTADPVGYVPVSWMAVASFAVMVVFVLVLAALAVTARSSKTPLITPQLLALPAVAVVLAFAARRIVRNSEGTRTGELFGVDLINAAWWGSVVVGLVYVTYMAAVEYSIRREADAEVSRWVGQITKDELTRAFHRTRDPKERASIPADDTASLENRYRTDWLVFRQSDLVRIASRNPGACEYVPGSLREWSAKAGGVECVATGTLRCPEGVFPLQFALKAVEGSGAEAAGRQWQVSPGPNGFLRDEPRLTPYGWFVADLQQQARETAALFLRLSADRVTRPFTAYELAKLSDEPALRLLGTDAGAARLALVGAPAGLGWQLPDEIYAATARRLFRLPGGKAPSPEQFKSFLSSWSGVGIVPPGVRLKMSPDVHEILAFTDSAVEVRIPVEIPLMTSKSDLASRGRLVVVCTDPAALAEAKRLRAEANPDAGGLAPPTGNPRTRYAWRVDRVESDLRPVSPREAGAPDPAAGLGGPPGF